MPHSITGHIVVVDISNFLLLLSIPHSLCPQPASLIIGVFTCWDDPNLHFWSDWNVCHPSFIVCVFISLLNFPWTRLIYLLLLWIIIRYGNTKRSPRGSLVFLPPLGLYSKTRIYTWQLESINPPSTLTLYLPVGSVAWEVHNSWVTVSTSYSAEQLLHTLVEAFLSWELGPSNTKSLGNTHKMLLAVHRCSREKSYCYVCHLDLCIPTMGKISPYVGQWFRS